MFLLFRLDFFLVSASESDESLYDEEDEDELSELSEDELFEDELSELSESESDSLSEPVIVEVSESESELPSVSDLMERMKYLPVFNIIYNFHVQQCQHYLIYI